MVRPSHLGVNHMYSTKSTGIQNSLIGWIYKQSSKHYWRVSGWYEFDDLIQDGMYVAIKCQTKYGKNLPEKQFAALVRTAFTNHITDLANKRTTGKPHNPEKLGFEKNAQTEVRLDDEALELLSSTLKEDSTQFLAVVIHEAPAAVRRVFFLFSDLEQLKKVRKPLKNGETINDRLCSLINAESFDICGLVREYFSSV
jgi:hypothetical protein